MKMWREFRQILLALLIMAVYSIQGELCVCVFLCCGVGVMLGGWAHVKTPMNDCTGITLHPCIQI